MIVWKILSVNTFFFHDFPLPFESTPLSCGPHTVGDASTMLRSGARELRRFMLRGRLNRPPFSKLTPIYMERSPIYRWSTLFEHGDFPSSANSPDGIVKKIESWLTWDYTTSYGLICDSCQHVFFPMIICSPGLTQAARIALVSGVSGVSGIVFLYV